MKNLLQVYRALRAKKNLNFKSIKSTTKTKRSLNEVLCLSKRGFLLLGLLLTLSVGQMWADATLVVGCAANNTSNYTVKLGVQAKDWDWQGIDMTKAGTLTFEGKKLYVTSYKTQDSKIIGEMKFMLYSGSTWKAETVPLSSWNENTDFHTNEIWNYDGGAWYTKQTMGQSKVYFDASDWSQTSIYMVIAHANHQKYYAMTNVANTKLYYTNESYSWTDAMGVGVVGRSSYVSGGTAWINDISSHGGEYTGLKNYGINNNGANAAYLIVNAGNSGQQPTISYNDSYASLLNSTQTIESYVSTNYGSSYSKANSKATITITSYRMTAQGTSGATSSNGTLSTSANSTTVTSARTATTTLSVGAVAAGYVFVGWYDSSNNLLSESTSYTYYPKGATTIRARFKNETSHSVSVSYTCSSPSATVSTATTPSIGETTYSAQTAPTVSGYTFDHWEWGTGISVKAGDDLNSNPIHVKTLNSGNYTMTAYYTEDLTSTYRLRGAWTNGWADAGQITMSKKTGHSTEDWVYCTRSFTTSESTAIKIYDSNGGTYYGAQNSSNTLSKTVGSLTVSGWILTSVEGGSNINFRHDISGTYEFAYNTSTHELRVTWPEVNQLYISAANPTDATNTNAFDLSALSSNVHTVTRTLNANTTYTFKIVYGSDWYGNGGSLTRSTSTSSNTLTGLSTSGGNMTITTDYAGSYTFKFNQSTKTLSVDYPEAYRAYFEVGNVKGNKNAIKLYRGSIDNANVISSGSWVLKNTVVYFWVSNNTTQSTFCKDGYNWWGFYDNAAGTTPTQYRNSSVTVYYPTITSDLHVYAVFGEKNNTITLDNVGNGHIYEGEVSVNATTAHVETESNELTATPLPGWRFDHWTIPAGITAKSGYTTTSNPLIINATTDATLTATYDPRWAVGGVLPAGTSWSDPSKEYQINDNYYEYPSSGKYEGQTTIDLAANTQYPIKIRDRETNKWYGFASGSSSDAVNIVYGESGTYNTLTNASGEMNIYLNTAAAGTYTFKWNETDKKLAISYPTSVLFYFGQNDALGGSVAAVDDELNVITNGQYAKELATVTFTASKNTGYTFDGWYKDEACTAGNELSAVDNSYCTISISDNVLTFTNKTYTEFRAYAKFSPKTYTVTFNPGTGSCTPTSKSVTYDAAYGTLPTPTPPGADSFVGWYTESSGGTLVTAETIVSTASNHTLYARYESTFTVTVQYKCGGIVLRPETTTNASASSVTADISAPDFLGYEFVNWTGSNATFGNASSANTTVNVTAATTITANYNAVAMVYFKNNLDWDSVFVSFDIDFVSAGGATVPKNNGKPYYKMTQVGMSDIFYCRIPDTYTSSNYAGWKGNIAFDNKGGFGNYTTTHIGNSNSFYKNEFLGRGDFDPNATMFIPYNGATETRNSGTYYTRGCWIQYNSNYSGYKVRVNTYVQGSGGSEAANVTLTSSVAGATEFTAKVWLPTANHTYGVMLWKDYLKNSNDLWYTNVNNVANTITSATNSLPWAWEPCTDAWQRCRVKAEAIGDYIFTVSFATGIPMVDVEYPVTVGDFRLKYTDEATWSNNAHDASWYHLSRVIKHANDAVDTVSFFVSYGSTPAIKLQKCTNISAQGVETWTDQSTVSLTSITEAGVYNFKITQSANASSATVACIGAYLGNYYIRTDASDGGWSNYTDDANKLTYSEYSLSHGGSAGPYSHYFMRHVNKGSNIKFCIANDYSMCISDTLVSDTYANEWIEREANVRFSWNSGTNKIVRSYISGSSNISDRFLVLEGDEHLYNESGQALTTAGGGKVSGLNNYEMNFIDDQNWIYETTVKADPGERIKLTAKFGDNVQYFYGAEGARAEGTTYQLIGGTTGGPYKIRVVYDFKTNRLVSAWMPDGDVTSEFKVEADVMIIRYHQQDAQQITFNASGKLTDVKTVYGTMQFNKYRLNNEKEAYPHDNLGLSRYARDLFFISFPFDVKLNDVFGFGTYGKHWIIEYYDGKGRAEKGFWKDSPSNWKFVTKAMKDGFTLKANEGYVLALDLDELEFSSSVWNYGVENVYLYFPSTATVDKIQATSATIDIDQTGYECTINRNTPDGDRRVKDSYWHLLGVPSYANAGHTTNGSWVETTVPNLDPADWKSSAPFVYEWRPSDNKYDVVSTSSHLFKPMRAYLAQYARDTIMWRQVNAKPASIVARRETNEIQNYEFRLEMQQNGEEKDHTFINLRNDEEVTNGFDFNYDLCKMLYGAFTTKNNLYTIIDGNIEVAGNSLPISDQTTVVPVGVQVGTAGDYTFTIPDGTNGVGVTLVDTETGIRTSLSALDYTIALEAGTYDNRFIIEISPIKPVATGVEEVTGDGLQVSGVRKVLIDNTLYIVKDGVMYDARGARVQ